MLANTYFKYFGLMNQQTNNNSLQPNIYVPYKNNNKYYDNQYN